VAGHGIAVIKMRMVLQGHPHLAAGIHLDLRVAMLIDALDGAQLAVGDVALLVPDGA